MRRKIALATMLLLATSTLAQNKSELPLYGSEPKTKEELAADEVFIKEVSEAAGSRSKAFEKILKLGWDALTAKDLTTATKRFNQAYLLDPKNHQPYWGLGILAGTQGRIAESISLFERGYQTNPKDPYFLCDYGFAIVGQALASAKQPSDQRLVFERLKDAEKKYREAIKLNSTISLPYARLAVLSFYRGDFSGAWKQVQEAERYGGEGLEERFLRDLQAASPRLR